MNASTTHLQGIDWTERFAPDDADDVKFGRGDADDVDMGHARELRSSRGRLLGTLVAAACLCWLAVEAPPHAIAEGSIARLDEPGTALRTAERIALRPPPVPGGKLMFPVSAASDCYVLDNFGHARGSTRFHEGVDIMGSKGAPVHAVASGVLTKRYIDSEDSTAGWGWTLYDASTKTTYKYYHLAEDPAGLVEGSSVTVGQTIGYVGSSGTSGEDNNHLHFEVRPLNVAVDPLPLLVVDRNVCGVSLPIRG